MFALPASDHHPCPGAGFADAIPHCHGIDEVISQGVEMQTLWTGSKASRISKRSTRACLLLQLRKLAPPLPFK